MLNLLKLKKEQAEAKANNADGEGGGKAGGKVIPAAQRRVQKGTLHARRQEANAVTRVECNTLADWSSERGREVGAGGLTL
eukprot:3555567-Rhodomonas_salina.2